MFHGVTSLPEALPVSYAPSKLHYIHAKQATIHEIKQASLHSREASYNPRDQKKTI
jgi:hypothetical protein